MQVCRSHLSSSSSSAVSSAWNFFSSSKDNLRGTFRFAASLNSSHISQSAFPPLCPDPGHPEVGCELRHSGNINTDITWLNTVLSLRPSFFPSFSSHATLYHFVKMVQIGIAAFFSFATSFTTNLFKPKLPASSTANTCTKLSPSSFSFR